MRRLEGWRNFLLVESFLAWSGWALWLLQPKGGYTAELLGAFPPIIYAVGGTVFLGILGRAGKSFAETWTENRRREKEEKTT